MSFLRRRKRVLGVLTLIYGLNVISVSAQETTIYNHELHDFSLAMELYDKEKYSAAQHYFDEIANKFSGQQSEVAITSRYYSAICALELFNDNAEFLLINFIRDYPEHPKTKVAHYQLGKYWFRKRRYNRTIEWFEKVSVYDLGNEDIAEYYFKLGYSYFMEENNAKALKAFYEIKDTDTRFTATARYYYAHLSYLDKKYETAYIDFKKIENHPKFAGIVPYYIAQIYFLQKKYDSLLVYAPPLLDSANTKRRPEIARLIGEAHYKKGEYKESIPFLEQYAELNSTTYDEAYELGFANYKAENFEQAIKWFESSIGEDDSLSQLSYYHMADCYLKLENKPQARNAMGRAAGMKFDDEIRENAMFNYAKLAYELSYHPYSDAIRAFEDYINTYPNSKRIPNAHEYLIGVYYTTKNYSEALKSLDRIDNRNIKLEQAYQKVAYLRGVELFKERHFEEAIRHFELSLTKNYDVKIRLSSFFWKAEAWHSLYKQHEAIEAYKEYLSTQAAITHENYNQAHYGLGYSHYRIKHYPAAIVAFRNYIRIENTDQKRKNDALIRTGDCYFINQQYDEAIEYYDRAIHIGLINTDYAMFQSGFSNGILKRLGEKENLLLTLAESYPESPYRDDALFELGKENMTQEPNKAIEYFDKLLKEYPNGGFVSQAYLKKGLVYNNIGDDDKALTSLKYVVDNFKNTQESMQALDKIRLIFTQKGDLEGFQAFLASSPELHVEKSKLDSAQYEIAENNYMQGKCDEAVKSFTNYLNSDSTGLFELNARFYRAECEYKSGYTNEALLDYKVILKSPGSKFYETALAQSARITYQLKNYDGSFKLYKTLIEKAEIPENIEEAQVMLCRLSFERQDYSAVIEYGNSALKQEKMPIDIREEIQLKMAKSYQKLDDYNKSSTMFREVAKYDSEVGAEAKYNVAAIEFLRGNLDSCEYYIMQAVNQGSFGFWIAKSLLLLSDVFVAKDDLFQAKYTVESVLENYEGEELRGVARSKLDLIINKENKLKEEKQKPDEEIIIQETEEDYDYLFEEEVIDENIIDE